MTPASPLVLRVPWRTPHTAPAAVLSPLGFSVLSKLEKSFVYLMYLTFLALHSKLFSFIVLILNFYCP